jgi:uncharacterized protein (DUF608 family)
MQTLVVELGKYVFAKITSVGAAGANFMFDVNSAQEIANANIIVYAIEAYSAAEEAKDQLGNTLVAAAGAPSLIYTLKNTAGDILLENYSFQRTRTSQNSGFPVYLNDFKIDLTKCYVTLASTTSVNANEVAGFVLYYKKK